MQLSEIEQRALQLVMEGRVHIDYISSEGAAGAGKVDGTNDTYSVSFSPAGRVCTCPAGAHHRRCSHAIALELAVLSSLVKAP